MARTLVIKKVILAGRTFEFNEKLNIYKGPYNAVVNFYRSDLHSQNKFGVKDTGYTGSFGFDKFDKKVMAEGLIENYKTLAGVQTKKETINNNHNYLCSYLSIWPPNVDGNTKNTKNKVDLYIKAAPNNNKNKTKQDIDTEQVTIESSDPYSITVTGTAKLNKSLKINDNAQKITIECLKPFSKEITITAKAQGKVIGKLIIYPNAIRYKTIIQPVEIKLATTEGKIVTKKPQTSIFTSLLNDFNTTAFNQAYIYGELATDTHEITLSKAQFNKFLTNKSDGNIYLKKDTENDLDTSAYNDLVENRYAALLTKQGTQNKTQEKLKEKEDALILAFDKHYKFTKTGIEYTKKQHKKEIVTNAWEEPDVIKAYTDYDAAKKAYDNMESAASGLNKKHKLHLFYSHDIYAARSPEEKVLAYSSPSSGVVHVFNAGLTSKIVNPTILHELGHSLGLPHTFNLGDYIVREPNTVYEEDLEKEIKILENDLKKKENKKKELKKQQKKVVENRDFDNFKILENYYKKLEKSIVDKNTKIFLEAIDRTKIMENNLSGSIFSVAKTTSIVTLDWKIRNIETKISVLEKQKKGTTNKLTKLSKSKAQSKTLENYMDYNQAKGSSSINTDMQRKLFYKWQWDKMRKIGSSNNYLEHKNK